MADHRKTKVPEHWDVDKIGNRIKVNYGKSQATVRDVDGVIPVYGTGGRIEFARRHLHQGESVLLGRKGTLDNPIYLDHPFWPVDTTYYTSDFDGSMKWFYYVTQSLNLALLSEATGVPSLSRDTFCRLEIPFPPVQEQIVIAEILTTVDRAIEQTEALIAKQRRIKAGLLHDLLTRGIDEHGNLRDPATHRFKESPVGLAPEEWEVTTLSQVVPPGRPIVYGILMPGQGFVGGTPVVKVKDISDDGEIKVDDLLLTDPRIDAAYHRSRLRAGDLLFTIRGTVGRMAFVPTALDGANITQDTARISISKANPHFIRYCLEMPISRSFIDLHTLGQAVKGINLEWVRQIPIPLPMAEEQERIASRLDLIDQEICSLRMEFGKVARLKTGLMQDLLSGRAPVSKLLSQSENKL